MKKNALFVNSVFNAMKIMEIFDTQTYCLNLTEVAQRSGLTISAAQRYLYTLEKLGYLEKLPSKRYTLTLKNLFLASNFLSQSIVVNTVYPHIVQLRQKIDARIGLSQFYGEDKVVYLIPLQSNTEAYQTDYPGFTVPAYSTSSGRMFLSFKSDAEIKEMLLSYDKQAHNNYTKVYTNDIFKEIIDCRKKGYCLTDQEYRLGNINIAVPIMQPGEQVIACIVAIFKSANWQVESIVSEIVPQIQEIARNIKVPFLTR